MPEPLHPYWVIYELMRVDLVIALAHDEDRLARLEALKLEWSCDLIELCRLDCVEAAVRVIGERLPNPFQADTSPEARFGESCYAVLAVPPL